MQNYVNKKGNVENGTWRQAELLKNVKSASEAGKQMWETSLCLSFFRISSSLTVKTTLKAARYWLQLIHSVFQTLYTLQTALPQLYHFIAQMASESEGW